MGNATAQLPIYLVCGFPRSGTSMLMRCLEAGGIPCVYEREHDAANNRSSRVAGYVPNPNGFYESNARHADWSQYLGKAIKCLHGEHPQRGHRYSAAYLWRNPAEIRRSMQWMISDFSTLGGYEVKVRLDIAGLEAFGADVTLIKYHEIVADPAVQLARLGWPIDIEKAAAMVDPSLYRNREAS